MSNPQIQICHQGEDEDPMPWISRVLVGAALHKRFWARKPGISLLLSRSASMLSFPMMRTARKCKSFTIASLASLFAMLNKTIKMPLQLFS